MTMRHISATAMTLTAAAALVLSACSTASDQASKSANAGPAPAASITKPSQLKIAYFSAGTGDSYLQSAIKAAHAEASKLGAKLDVFDGQFNAQTQYNQIQTALTSGKYNAFAVEPNDGNLLCNQLTKQAAAKGILVSVFNEPICGRAVKSGDQLWQPGTVTYVGGQTVGSYNQWVKSIMAANPSGGKVAVITGPDLNANTLVMRAAEKPIKANSKFKIVSEQTTDYSTPKAFTAAQTILQANPGLGIIISNYSGMTQGIVQAVNGAGKKGKVKVYDFGGDSWSLGAVKAGNIAQTVVMLPKQETIEAIDALADVVSGKKVDHFIDLTKSPKLPGTAFVTPQNVAKFTAEY